MTRTGCRGSRQTSTSGHSSNGQILVRFVEKIFEEFCLVSKVTIAIVFSSSHHQFFVQREYNMMWCKVPPSLSRGSDVI